jgi:hypothetical protein
MSASEAHRLHVFYILPRPSPDVHRWPAYHAVPVALPGDADDARRCSEALEPPASAPASAIMRQLKGRITARPDTTCGT